MQPGTALKQRFGQLGAGGDQVLAIVQDQEQFFAAQVGPQGLDQRAARLLAHSQRRRDLLGDEERIGQRRVLDQPAALGLLVVLNAPFYGLLLKRRGPLQAAAGVGLHTIHHVTAACAVPLGLFVHLRARRAPRGNRAPAFRQPGDPGDRAQHE